MEWMDLSGKWTCRIPGITAEMALPGTLDENGIGFPDEYKQPWHPEWEGNSALQQREKRIATRLTRRHTWEGPARISRKITGAVPEGKRIFLEAERARCLKLEVNGKAVPHFLSPSISTPHIFEVTGLLTGEDEIALISDNSYPGLPYGDIVNSSAATDETQTNWNGVLGYFRFRAENPCFIHRVRVLPRGNRADVCVTLSVAEPWEGELRISSGALEKEEKITCRAETDATSIWLRNLPLRPEAARWDEGEGNLHELTVTGTGLEAKTVRFGIRDFGDDGAGHLAMNGRRIFLRSEANCCVFPETGHPPMTAAEWRDVLTTYQSYGVNCMRFHSHIPPEAAFTAADELGMMMQPELSHWNPKDAFESEASFGYYQTELRETILWISNHPSFVMMTFGNELFAGETGRKRMTEMLRTAHDLDNTRLYAFASNGFYGGAQIDPENDFYTSQSYFGEMIRATSAEMIGHLNQGEPAANHDYSAALMEIRKEFAKPVFSFEVGQYEVLPDFREIGDFRGVTRADNLEIIRDRVAERGWTEKWPRYCEATGELSLLCYREEAEAALRTGDLSGISLLGLQDFPGQGTALVGMLNSHLQPKPYAFAQPERFAAFFRPVLPLALLPAWTWFAGAEAEIPIRIANYGKQALEGALRWELRKEKERLAGGELSPCQAEIGLADAGMLRLKMPSLETPARLELHLSFAEHQNTYSLWVYPRTEVRCPKNVYETGSLDEKAEENLRGGGRVYLSPDAEKEHMPHSIRTQFSTDFWSVGTFPKQEGGMGQLIDSEHPVFRDFPTEFHTDWQWHRMASQRAFILPRAFRAIITEMDSYAYLRPMAQLMEVQCLGGKLMLSSLNLHQLQAWPECRALQNAIYTYMGSDDFRPDQEMSLEEIRELVK